MFWIFCYSGNAPWARATNNVMKPQNQMYESCRKLVFRFFQSKTETFLVLVTHLILRFANVQNKFQKTNETKVNHINDNHIKLWFLYIIWRSGLSSLLRVLPVWFYKVTLDSWSTDFLPPWTPGFEKSFWLNNKHVKKCFDITRSLKSTSDPAHF